MNEIRYLLYQCTDQADKVNDKLEHLDFETIQLNVEDLAAKMKVANAELSDIQAELTKYFAQEDDIDVRPNN